MNTTCVHIRQSSRRTIVRFSGIFNPLAIKDKQRTLVIVKSEIYLLCTTRASAGGYGEGEREEKKTKHTK